MKLLAFDCTDQACSVALKIDDQLVERHIDEPRQHSKQLLSNIDGLLSESATCLSSLDGIAFAAGPGSFTGLRIAVSVAQALGFAHNTPLFPVSSLQALAATANRLHQFPLDSTVVSVFDARMQQLYWSSVRVIENGGLERLSEDLLESVETVVATKFPSNSIFVGPGSKFLTGLAGDHHIEMQIHAEDVAQLATADFDNQRGIQSWEAQPTYLRGSDAWKKLEQQINQREKPH